MKTLPTTKDQIIKYLDTLSPRSLEQTLAFVKLLATHTPEGIPAQELSEFFTRFPMTPEEAEEMTHILEDVGR